LIIDSHAHVSAESYSSPELILANMELSTISRTVLIPGGMLDVRRMTEYVLGKAQPVTQDPPNEFLLSLMNKHPDKFSAFCCIDPNRGSVNAQEQLQWAKQNGFSGLKMAPMVHQFSLLGETSKALAVLCGDLGLPFYTHVLPLPSASTASIGILAKEFPRTNFVIGHMGFGPLDVEAIELASVLDNVFLETSSSNFLALDIAVRKAGASKLVFGSEFPLSDPMVEIAKVGRLRISQSERDQIYSGNIIDLIQLPRHGGIHVHS
jgi:predicted TIM-barrel fold metal-dependent hydrolase